MKILYNVWNVYMLRDKKSWVSVSPYLYVYILHVRHRFTQKNRQTQKASVMVVGATTEKNGQIQSGRSHLCSRQM